MMARAKWAFSIAAICAAVACGDRAITSPEQPGNPAVAPPPAKMTVGVGEEIVLVLKRSAPLQSDLKVSGVIGPRGGQLEIGHAGIRIDFAPGAVTVPTLITITAARGANVEYEFQPHGLRFAAPVTVRQSLKKTAAEHDEKLAATLQGSYFERPPSELFADAAQSYARIREARKGKLNKTAKYLEFSIEHFSGYMVSTGKAGGVEVEIEVEIH